MSDLKTNEITPIDAKETDILDDLPTANESGRENKNGKKLKVVLLIFVGIIIVLIGIGVSMGRFQASSAAHKAEEAEKAAQEQKQIADGKQLDIDGDKKQIENSDFKDLPCPVSDPSCQQSTEGQQPADGTQPPIEQPVNAQGQEQPVVQPVQPKYQTYNQSTDAPAQAQPVQPVQPVQQQTLANAAPVATAQEDDVLVDFGSQTAVAASTGTTQKETGLAKSLESSKLLQGNATKRGDVTMLLAKGTSIPCVLNTKIDSTYKGFTTCQISKDVYSANGKVLLLERGSTVFGEQNVDIKQGQARVAVLWSRIETPKGVSVDIDSPATGKLGEMGLGAKVNNHFWKRFGGAIMLSMIQDITSNAATRLQKDGAAQDSNSSTNTQQAAQSMAEKTLDNTINIPPTATVNHGSMINIHVVRDVDFGGIYELRKF